MARRTAKPDVRIIAGPAHSGKTGVVLRAFREALEADSDSAVLILPTSRAAESLRTDLLLDGTFDVLPGSRVLTFTRFARAVLEREAPEVRFIDAAVQDEFLSKILGELVEAGDLPHHARVVSFRGFVRAMREFLDELKRAEIGEGEFAAWAKRPRAPRKDRELSTIYTRYQVMLQERNLYDEPGLFWRARLLIADGKPGPFAALKHLFLDAFYDFTPAQIALMQVLAARGVAVTMSLPLEERSDRAELFEAADATLAELGKCFRANVEMIGPEGGAKQGIEPDLAYLSQHLFEASPADSPPRPASIEIIETPGTLTEVREIAREIKRLHLEEGVPLEGIAVVFRTLSEYRDVVAEVFGEFGIPARIGGGERLSGTQVGRLVLHLVRVASDGWHVRDVMSLLKSNYVSAAALGLDGDGLSVARFEALLTEAGTIAGRANWQKNLKALAERLAARLEARTPGDEDEEIAAGRGRREDAARKVSDLALANDACDRIFALFAPLEEAKTTAACADALLNVVDALRIGENVTRSDDKHAASRDLDALDAVRKALAGLVRTATVAGVERVTLPGFQANLKSSFGDRTVGRMTATFGRVQVCEVHEVRALAFDVVFIGGLLERSFPRRRHEGPFYDDDERTKMVRRGLRLHPRRVNQREERFLFYLAATRARKRLYLTYPVTDREGKEKLVSYYVGEVRRLFAPHEIAAHEVTLSTRLPRIDRCASLTELRRATVWRLSERRLREAVTVTRAAAVCASRDARAAMVLKRALEGEAERDSWEYFGVHDGVLSHAEAVAELKKRFGRGYGFSVTRLETYAGCPFAFFCASVLGLEPPAEPPEEVEAVDEGVLLHRTLRAFYAERRDASDDPRIAPDAVDAAKERIREIADGHLDAFRRRNPDLNEGLFLLQRESMHEMLGAFVEAESAAQARDAFAMVPRCFEAVFGMAVTDLADPRSTPERLVIAMPPDAPVEIVGKIDRIDVSAAAVSGDARGFRVVDYKRKGSGTTKRDLEEGTALQMPIYLLAVRDVVLAGDGLEPVDAQFYGIVDAKATTALRRMKMLKGGVAPDASGDAIIETALESVKETVRGIRSGDFPVVLRASRVPCAFCDFRRICRYTESRARKKLGEYRPWFMKHDDDKAKNDG